MATTADCQSRRSKARRKGDRSMIPAAITLIFLKSTGLRMSS